MSLFFTSYHSIIVSRKNISYSGPFMYLGFLYYVIIFHFVSYYHRITKKYLTQGLSYTLGFYIMSLFFISYHTIIVSRKNIFLRAFCIPRIFILCHYFSLRIIVSSYHEKIYLTQGLSYTSDFYIMSSFFTLYHSIIVSRKNISYPGLFIYLGFFILCHYFSLRIISSYHEKIYLTQGLSYTSDFYIMSLFFTSYHRITEKYILLRAFHIPRIFIQGVPKKAEPLRN